MVQVFICHMLYADTLGMQPCPKCGELTYVSHEEPCGQTLMQPVCDFTEEELAEARQELLWCPDADYDEVSNMLGDDGTVVFVDPWPDNDDVWPEVI